MQIDKIPTPAYVVDEGKLIKNLEILERVQDDTGCKILLAQKAFSMFCEYPLIGKYLSGTTASGLYEARLGREEMGKENHIFSPAYRESEMDEIAGICDHVIFNSFSQLRRFGPRCIGKASIGLRINPECSTQGGHTIYDPCAPGSRLGVTQEVFDREMETSGRLRSMWPNGDGERNPDILECVDGLHFHTLCEQNADDLEVTLEAVERRFAPYLKQVKWLNMGGGHHITRADYDLERLEKCIRHMQETYDLQIYLEPGEAIALNAGYLVTEVMDIVENGGATTLILDVSAACHMPDVLEMPYRPPLYGSGEPHKKPYTYRLSSCTCLAGDIIGDYSFDREIHPGDRLYFEDMAIYSMVKNNTFNGIALPSIWVMEGGAAQNMSQTGTAHGIQKKLISNSPALADTGCAAEKPPEGECRLVKKFGYADFRGRLS
ncbi:MAG: carboxynorspermidine decarboxylase [Lachnospiraceae bacterium]|nr:carboxynorspermidine decarboxylase [Lachnospiraceae bacterium]